MPNNRHRITALMCSACWSLVHTALAAGSLPADVVKAWQLYYNGHADKSFALSKAALTHSPSSADWQEVMAISVYEKSPTGALSYLEQALKPQPTNPRLLAAYAMVSLKCGHLAEAAQAANRALANDAHNARAMAVLATCQHKAGNVERAQEQFALAVDAAPNDYFVNMLAFDFYKYRLDDERALAAINRLVRNCPESATVFDMRAHFKQANDDPLGAVADFGTVIKLDPTNNTALGKRARILANTGHKKEALAAFEQWQRAYPNFPSVYFYKGRFEHDIGLWQQAIKDLQSAVSKSNGKEAPGNVYLLPNPGTRSHSMDNKNYKLSWIMQTEILGQLGQADAALYDADQILRADPNCDAMLSLRQKLLRQKGRWADAIRDLDKLIALDADVSDFYQWRGEAYQHLNKKEKAEADLAKAKHIEQYGQ